MFDQTMPSAMPGDVIFPIDIQLKKSDVKLILKQLKELRRERDWYEKLRLEVVLIKRPLESVGVHAYDPLEETIMRSIAYRDEAIRALERVLQTAAEKGAKD